MTSVVFLAYDENNIQPGWIALGLVLLLGLATFLLWRSMNTQLGKIKAPHKADLLLRERGESRPAPDASTDAGAETDPEPTDPDEPTGPDTTR